MAKKRPTRKAKPSPRRKAPAKRRPMSAKKQAGDIGAGRDTMGRDFEGGQGGHGLQGGEGGEDTAAGAWPSPQTGIRRQEPSHIGAQTGTEPKGVV